jgi:hypothetical protein
VGCRDWREHVDPSAARAAPEQTRLEGAAPIELSREGYVVKLSPRATYRTKGYVADLSRELLDEWDWLMPLDLGLVWGPLLDPEVLPHMSFHLTKRYFSWKYRPPAGGKELPANIGESFANNHLIPADDEVRRMLDAVKVGDLVTLEGRLVDVEIRDRSGKLALRSPTSLTRKDLGNGACEQLWVEHVIIER